MAEKLLKYYQYISEHGGLTARTKLAMLTKVPSTKAAMEPDTPETIKKFKEMVGQITGSPPPDY
jgi:hypothetical protein